MKGNELLEMGIPRAVVPEAVQLIRQMAGRGVSGDEMRRVIAEVIANPQASITDPELRPLAEGILARPKTFEPREAPAPFRIWGEGLEPTSVQQMKNAADLPVAVRGALMPDAHQGYGLPIGGVLATENAVIPYAVGVDIACRMKLSILDLDPAVLDGPASQLEQALRKETQFGTGAKLRRRADHPAMDDERWRLTGLAKRLRDKAWEQLGTSGSGNHFVEFGVLTLPAPDLGLEAGRYVALLSHSGSRGSGAQIAAHYSKLARELHPELPKELSYLSWLDLDHDSGREYLELMRLMGEYASANHAVIHERVTGFLKAGVLAGVENHHNFAWTSERDGREIVVHRKGATPAAAGELGVIPGSMAAPGFIVRGKGLSDSIESASHGAGRRMSRTEATKTFNWKMVQPVLKERGVKLLSAGIDENPFAYKDIETVMAAQTALVDVVGRFDPRIVRMGDAGERPED
jgi:tRNA-splicing ligase RtcB